MIVAWVLGAFLGGLVASRIAMDAKRVCAMIVGSVMVILAGVNLVMIPHPAWMAVLGLALPIPAAWLAAACGGGQVLNRSRRTGSDLALRHSQRIVGRISRRMSQYKT